ncbi:MAG: UDP-N-acetylmuramate--L-alanine ligase [Flavobacteriaceae bacterium]|nr:UDP-N-acetylmuramate--L-alanine ligase [Flavobacteriaceae bacterium]
MNITSYTYYYFIGIGGIGMSAIARYFNQMGKTILGYDRMQTELTKQLELENIKIHFEDDEKFIPNELQPQNTLVIYTPAIPKNHQELHFFQNNGFKVIKRAEALGEITRATTSLAVAGTHGKTTTSAMLGHLLYDAGLESTAFVGGIVENYNSNVILGGNKISVIEADEFDRSFLKLNPDFACITSMDADHLDIYGDGNELIKSFNEFAKIVRSQVFVKNGIEIKGAQTYGVEELKATSDQAIPDYYADNILLKEGYFTFDLTYPHGKIESISMTLPGRHNIENAVAAIALAMQVGVNEKQIKQAMASFKGIKRRFSRYTSSDGKIIIDDYAHHPTELNAIIQATQNFYPGKSILGIFQPHLFSRTRDFISDFAKSLSGLQNLILIDIYPARENPIEGVTSDWLADEIEKINSNRPLVVSLDKAFDEILKFQTDIILLMGAGNIDTLYQPLKMHYV